jgi:hypothetical protein
MWYIGNALLDGLNPGSDSPRERFLFHVYQRRLLLDAMKTKAQLLASMGQGEQAAKIAQAYLDMAIPVSAKDKNAKLMSAEEQLKASQKTGYRFRPIIDRDPNAKKQAIFDAKQAAIKAGKTPSKAPTPGAAPEAPGKPKAPPATNLGAPRPLPPAPVRPAPAAPQAPMKGPPRPATPSSFPKAPPKR